MSVLQVEDLEAWVRRCAELVSSHAEELTALDAAIGDADHGANMRRGLNAVVEVLDGGAFTSVDALLKRVGMTLVSKVGGASGPLYGTLFMRMGASQQGASSLDAGSLAEALDAGVAGIVTRGRAGAGEKTMLDAWYPALEALRSHPEDLAGGVEAAARAAARGRDATEPMVATKGRASYLGERSVGHVDPGAASTALILQALAETVGRASQADGSTNAPGRAGQPGQPGEEQVRVGGHSREESREGGAPQASGAAVASGDAQAVGSAASPAPAAGAGTHREADPGEQDDGTGGAQDEAQDSQVGQVGIVLVSHSRALAQDALALARQLVTSVSTAVEVAAGLPDGSLGTDSAYVAAAVERVAATSSGVLVLVDLGSAVMSTDAALELVSPQVAARTRISSAPFVEGLVGAYAAAGIGRDLDAAAAEAESASRSKAAQVDQLGRAE